MTIIKSVKSLLIRRNHHIESFIILNKNFSWFISYYRKGKYWGLMCELLFGTLIKLNLLVGTSDARNFARFLTDLWNLGFINLQENFSKLSVSRRKTSPIRYSRYKQWHLLNSAKPSQEFGLRMWFLIQYCHKKTPWPRRQLRELLFVHIDRC